MESQALVRYDRDRPRGLFGRLRGAMEKWTLAQGGPELEARLARLIAPQNEYGVDPFGMELEFAKAAIAPALWLYKRYFRVQTIGLAGFGALLGLIGLILFISPVRAWVQDIYWFVAKVAVFMYLYIWYRATWPRYRFDQLMRVGWKVMLPISLGVLIVTAIIGVLLG